MANMEDKDRWLLVYFPFLQLSEDVILGPWDLRRSNHLRGMWPTSGLSEVGRRFIGKHRTALGQPVKGMTIACVGRGATLEPPGPSTEELNALQAAVTLGVLAKNPTWNPERENDSWRVSTSDNTVLRATWLTQDMRWYATERGSMVQTLSGGHQLERRSDYIAAPLELHPVTSSIDTEVAAATYAQLLENDNREDVARLLTSITWLAQVWANSPSISWNIRTVALRTGIEVLLHKRGAWTQARALRHRFEELTEMFLGATFDTLWSPDEGPDLEVRVEGKTKKATPLEHWYMALAQHRNATVHDVSDRDSHVYEVGTAYDGPFIWTGERVLRDLLRTELTLATGQPLVFEGIGRALRIPGLLDSLLEAFSGEEPSD